MQWYDSSLVKFVHGRDIVSLHQWTIAHRACQLRVCRRAIGIAGARGGSSELLEEYEIIVDIGGYSCKRVKIKFMNCRRPGGSHLGSSGAVEALVKRSERTVARRTERAKAITGGATLDTNDQMTEERRRRHLRGIYV